MFFMEVFSNKWYSLLAIKKKKKKKKKMSMLVSGLVSLFNGMPDLMGQSYPCRRT